MSSPVEVSIEDDEMSNLWVLCFGLAQLLAVESFELEKLLHTSSLAKHIWDRTKQGLQTPEGPAMFISTNFDCLAKVPCHRREKG